MITDAIKSPCKGCERRQPLCHARCGDYAQYKLDLEEIKGEVFPEVAKYEENEQRSKVIKACFDRRKDKR